VDSYDRILAELKNRAADKPEWADILSLYVDLQSAQTHVDVSHSETTALAQDAPARLALGLPILAPETFRADPVVLLQLCDEICAITARHRPDAASRLDAIRAWLDEEHESIRTVAAEYLRDEGFRKGEEAGLDGPLFAFVLNLALHPFLRKYAKILAAFVDESIWYRPICPICGGEPDFAALEKKTGARQLLCSRCDFEWAFWRVGCPFCGCDDPDKQKYSAIEGQAYSLCLCEQCGRCLKTIDLRQVEEVRLLPVERILTLAIDLAAQGVGSSGVSAAAPPA
jgi:FdhE protein